MRQRQASRFRPTLDALEGRVVLSVTTPSVAGVSANISQVPTPSPPVVTRATINVVMGKIDKAFSSYQGQDTSGIIRTIGGIAASAAGYVASAILSPNSTPDATSNGTVAGYVTGGQGDPYALQNRLQNAIDHLPFGKTNGPAIMKQVLGLGGMTPADANIFRGLFKTAVNHQIAKGVKVGDFVVK